MRTIRTATEADAAAIARLHTKSWRSAYRGIMPDRYLNGPLDEERLAYWRAKLRNEGDRIVVLVAEEQGVLQGFVAGWLEPAGGTDALIDNLHIDPDAKGLGHGRTLLGAAAKSLQERGAISLHLWVYDENRAALDFYARLGGTVGEHGLDPVDGVPLPHRRISWDDLTLLFAGAT